MALNAKHIIKSYGRLIVCAGDAPHDSRVLFAFSRYIALPIAMSNKRMFVVSKSIHIPERNVRSDSSWHFMTILRLRSDYMNITFNAGLVFKNLKIAYLTCLHDY